ncbi:hypothetical protein ILUMI_18199, partial [Ignelater luminosus]
KNKGKGKNTAKKRKTLTTSSDEEEYFCLVGAYSESRAGEKWIKCQGKCEFWSHLECAGGNRHYICHNCDESD